MNFGKPQQTRSRSIKAFGIWEYVGIWCQVFLIWLFHSVTFVVDFLPNCEGFGRQNDDKIIMISVWAPGQKNSHYIWNRQLLCIERGAIKEEGGGGVRHQQRRRKCSSSQGGWLHLEECEQLMPSPFCAAPGPLDLARPIRSSQVH